MKRKDINEAERLHGGGEVLARLDAAATYEPADGNGQAEPPPSHDHADEGHPDDEQETGHPDDEQQSKTRVEFEAWIDRLSEKTDFDELTSDIPLAIAKAGLRKVEEERLFLAIKKKTGATLGSLRIDVAAAVSLEVNPGSTLSPHLLAARETIKARGAENIICTNSGVWTWGAGVWERAEDRFVKQGIHHVADRMAVVEELTKSSVDSIFDLFKTETFRPDHRFDPPGLDFVNALNGELHLEDAQWRLRPHNREHYRTSQIPVAFDPSAKATRFERFLQEIFAKDEDADQKVQCILEMIGYSLLATARYERFLILIGAGANGKSVLLGAVEALLGGASVSAIQPDQFGNKFQRAHLNGKLANIITEMKEGLVIDDAALKAIVSGELSTAEMKFKDPFDFHPHATCWFGTNHLPSTRDFSDALFRRALIIEFNRKFEGEARDAHLKDKLAAELPGILNLALAAIAKVIKSGGINDPASSVTAKAEWRRENDQAALFLEEKCVRHQCASVASSTLYNAYRAWADGAGIHHKLAQKGFTKRLKVHGIAPKHTNTGNVFEGVGLNYGN